MRRLRKTAMAVLVWATAVSTLIGSSPRFECHCPDGTIKPICFGTTSAESSCCRGGCCTKRDGTRSCCQTTSPDRTEVTKRSCCGRNVGAPSDESPRTRQSKGAIKEKGLEVSGRCCQRILVHPDDSMQIRPEPKSNQNCSASVMLLPEVVAFESADHALADSRAFWQVNRLPPPTDLVTSLQRLTI
jgi:hypothetical protein